jgi:hypothetical protein
MYAARYGHALAVAALLAGGADTRPVNKVTKRGSSTVWLLGGGGFVLCSWPPQQQALPSTTLSM